MAKLEARLEELEKVQERKAELCQCCPLETMQFKREPPV